MKKVILILAIIFTGLSVFLFLNLIDKSDIATTDDNIANITFIKGNVTVTRDGQSSKAKLEDILYSSDKIIVGKESEIHFMFSSLGVFKLKSNTELILSQLGLETKVNLKKGKFFTALKKLKKTQKFNIQTPTAVAGVRGTSFFVNAHKNNSEIAVLTGSIEVDNGKSKDLLSKHKKANIGVSEISIAKVDKLTVSELKEIAKIANVEDYNLKAIKKSLEELDLMMGDENELGDINDDIKAKSIEKQRKQASEDLIKKEREIIRSSDEFKKKKSGYIDDKDFK